MTVEGELGVSLVGKGHFSLVEGGGAVGQPQFPDPIREEGVVGFVEEEEAKSGVGEGSVG